MASEALYINRDIYVVVSEWNNKPLVNIRCYLKNSNNVLIPQKRGISLTTEEFKKLEQLMGKIKRNIHKMEKSKSVFSEESYEAASVFKPDTKKSDEPLKKKKKNNV